MTTAVSLPLYKAYTEESIVRFEFISNNFLSAYQYAVVRRLLRENFQLKIALEYGHE